MYSQLLHLPGAMSAIRINCRYDISFRYPRSTDFLVALPIKQLGLIRAWCSLWASRLICKLIRSTLKAVSCPLGMLQLIASRCWNLVSATLGWLTPLWSQKHVRKFMFSLYSDQGMATPWHLSFSHWDSVESSGWRYSVFKAWPSSQGPGPQWAAPCQSCIAPCTVKCHIFTSFSSP